ncbi:hypothetical protein D9M70_517640 [compost metagenome]
MIVQARHRNFFLRLAEAHFDAALVWLHRVDRIDQDEADDQQADDGEDTAVETAGNDILKLVLTTANDLFQIRRATLAATRPIGPLAPWALIAAAAAAPWAAAAILIAPGHQNLSIETSHAKRPRHRAVVYDVKPL